jgi:large repetitive protein
MAAGTGTMLAGEGRRRRWRESRPARALLAIGVMALFATVGAVGVDGGPAVAASDAGTCTFSGTGVTSTGVPPGVTAVMTGATAGSGPDVSCTGLANIGIANPLVAALAAPTASDISPSADGGNETYLGYAESQGYVSQSSVSTVKYTPYVLPPTTQAIGGCPVSAVECELGGGYFAPDSNAACPSTSAWPQALVNAGFISCNVSVVISNGTTTYTAGSIDVLYAGQDQPAAPTATLSATSSLDPGQTVTVTGGTNWWGGDGTSEPGTVDGIAGGANTNLPAPTVWIGPTRATAVQATESTPLNVTAPSYVCTGGGGGDSSPGPAISCTSGPGQPVISGSFTVPAGLTPGANNVYIDEANASPTAGQAGATNTAGYNVGLSNGSLTAVESVTPVTVAAPPTVTTVTPDDGPGGGGNSVVLTGTGFTGATGVSFGSFAASTFEVNSPTQITVTAPNSDIPEFSSLTVDVRVTTPAGTSALNPPSDQYTYELPVPIPVPPGSLHPVKCVQEGPVLHCP